MSEVAPAAAAPAKVPRKKAASKPKKASGPSAAELVLEAVSASKERSSVSLAAVKKALAAGGYDVKKNNSRVKTAVKSLVLKGTLVQLKGTGASGSFKINKAEAKKPAKKAAPKAKKAPVKKPAAAKKVVAKKPAAKKSPKKAKKPAVEAKSPKKVAAKSPKKVAAKSPKKVAAKSPKKVAAKSPNKAVKKPAAKKAPAKKAAKPKAAKPTRTAGKRK